MLGKLFTSSTGQSVGRRMFSRADILKNLDRSKVSRKAFIKKELTENPEFFKAFPHLQGVLPPKEGTVPAQTSAAKTMGGDDRMQGDF